MRGRLLGVDGDTGLAMIAGEDGRRYSFARHEWKPAQVPSVGQDVDFEVRDGDAVAVYALGNAPVAATPPAPPRTGGRSRTVAAMLAFFLGGLGVHRFYLGRNASGLAMLLTSVFGIILIGIPTLIVALIAFVHFVLLILMSDREFDRRYA